MQLAVIMTQSAKTIKFAYKEPVLIHAYMIMYVGKMQTANRIPTGLYVAAFPIIEAIHMLVVFHMNVCKTQIVPPTLNVRQITVWTLANVLNLQNAAQKITGEYVGASQITQEIHMDLLVHR